MSEAGHGAVECLEYLAASPRPGCQKTRITTCAQNCLRQIWCRAGGLDMMHRDSVNDDLLNAGLMVKPKVPDTDFDALIVKVCLLD